MALQLIGYIGFALVVLAVMVVAYQFADGPAASRPELGPRGQVRRQVLLRGGWFSAVEPMLRFLAARIARLPLTQLRSRLTQKIEAAGDWLGLTADEYLALCALSGLIGGVLASLFAWVSGLGVLLIPMGVGLGLMAPSIERDTARGRRFKQVNRGLPAAIDLVAMCVGAGLDFPSSLRQVVQNTVNRDDGLRRELERILQELALGRTRRSALQDFAERVPTESVKDFCGSVVQSEEKGTPLIEVLRIQSTVLRMRRSVYAEEAAARAGVMMILPLLMIFACVFLILLGPFIVNLVENGL